MKKIITLLAVSFLVIGGINAQNMEKGKFRRFSIDISGGIPIVFSDVSNKFVEFDLTGRLNWHLTSAVSLGLEFGGGKVRGQNTEGAKTFFANRYLRAMAGGEVYLFNIFKANKISKWMQPYAGANFGFIKSDIETSGDMFSDNPVHFNDWSFAHQYNAGLKFKLTNMIDLNVSGNIAYLSTDFFDNYNPEVYNNRSRDVLATARLGLTFHLGKKANKSIIWKNEDGDEVDPIEDSIKLYTQNKLVELENDVITLERENKALKMLNSSTDQKVTMVDDKVNALTVKTNELEAKVENMTVANSNTIVDESSIVFFAAASNSISATEKQKITAMAIYLKANPKAKLLVKGYADKKGNEIYNFDLSLKRAIAVRDYLTTLGVEAHRIEAYGYGENILLPDSDSKNRRVVLELIK